MPAALRPHSVQTGRRRSRLAWRLAAACLALSSLVACASLDKKPTQPDVKPWPEIRSDFRVETLRARMHEYSITFAAEVDLAATAIEQRAADPTVRRNALLWRVRAIPEMRKACFRLEPVGALVDAWILARQMDQLFSEGAGAGAFGTFQPEAVGSRADSSSRCGRSAARLPCLPSHGRVRAQFIDPWLAEHPLRDITFVRESPMARFAEQSRAARRRCSQSVGTMEELAISLSQQARIYLADLPRQIREKPT